MHVNVALPKIRRLLVVITLGITLAGLLVEAGYALNRGEEASQALEFFSLSYEENLPSWYSSCLLFGCSALLALIAAAKSERGEKYVGHWAVLAAGFLYISLDEIAQLHERTNAWFHFGGVLRFGWVIPATAVVLVIALCFIDFLKHLDQRTRRMFLIAAFLYVGGAVGVEIPLGYWTSLAGDDNFVYAAIDHVEESMEMFGLVLFLGALLDVLRQPDGTLQIAFNAATSESGVEVGALEHHGAAPTHTSGAGAAELYGGATPQPTGAVSE